MTARACLLALAGAAGLAVPPASADDAGDLFGRLVTTLSPSRLHAGTTELGIAGAVVREGATTVALNLRGGRFLEVAGELLTLEADAGWTRVRDLDGLDLLGSAQWTPHPDASLLPFVGVLGGLRQEWVGSFRETRVPLGGALGLRLLVGSSAAFRVEYRYLYVTGDPIGDHGEHRIQFGVSALLGNRVRWTHSSSD